jgi:electron transport complex protein RnfG
MKEPKFKDQFNALNISSLPKQEIKVKKDGGTIDAITAATISSRAFCDGVQKAYTLYIKNFGSAAADSATIAKGVSK